MRCGDLRSVDGGPYEVWNTLYHQESGFDPLRRHICPLSPVITDFSTRDATGEPRLLTPRSVRSFACKSSNRESFCASYVSSTVLELDIPVLCVLKGPLAAVQRWQVVVASKEEDVSSGVRNVAQ